jgi:hypothetical protein
MRNRLRSTAGLLLPTLLLIGSLSAQGPAALYPGVGTTVNGKAVYSAVEIVAGAEVKTAGMASTVVFGAAELKLSPGSTLIIGNPFILSCGSARMLSGTAQVSDGNHLVDVSPGEVILVDQLFCGKLLPNAPSTVPEYHPSRPRLPKKQNHDGTPVAALRSGYVDFRVADSAYWAVTGAIFSSTIVTAEFPGPPYPASKDIHQTGDVVTDVMTAATIPDFASLSSRRKLRVSTLPK